MHVVLRGITIWTLYTLVSRVSVACLSTTNRVRLELVYDPMPDDLFEPYQYHPGQVIKRLYRRRLHGMVSAAAAVQRSKQVETIPECDCTLSNYPTKLDNNVFPNILPAVQCVEGARCKKIVYPFRVLTKQRVTGKNCNQDRLPKELKNANWWSYEHNITVACYCY